MHARHVSGFMSKSCGIDGGGDGDRIVSCDKPQCQTLVPIHGSFSSHFPELLGSPAHGLRLEESPNYSASLKLAVSIISFLTLVFRSPTPDSDLLVFAYLFSFAHRQFT